VCSALKIKEASLNLIRHLIGSQLSCLRSSLDDGVIAGDVMLSV